MPAPTVLGNRQLPQPPKQTSLRPGVTRGGVGILSLVCEPESRQIGHYLKPFCCSKSCQGKIILIFELGSILPSLVRSLQNVLPSFLSGYPKHCTLTSARHVPHFPRLRASHNRWVPRETLHVSWPPPAAAGGPGTQDSPLFCSMAVWHCH